MRYFVLIKLLLITVLTVNAAVFTDNKSDGISYKALFMAAVLFMSVVLLELNEEKREALNQNNGRAFSVTGILKGALFIELVSAALLIWGLKEEYIYLLPMILLDIVIVFRLNAVYYLSVYIGLLFTDNRTEYFTVASFIVIVYYQHYIILKGERIKTDVSTGAEEELKRSLKKSEVEHRKELDRSRLFFENSILEEKARLSQALHDKLGHSINGSVYQLEAVKVLMEKDREESSVMLQAVIDNLRTSMDEIRSLLRKERPEKKQLAFLQLSSLCEECRVKYGIEAEFGLNGNAEDISGSHWEILLDNCYEAVSNTLKYASCTKINIDIVVMHKLIRCTVSDNGRGCAEIQDGMGFGGMRRRIREANGFISFEGDRGFVINMLLPVEKG